MAEYPRTVWHQNGHHLWSELLRMRVALCQCIMRNRLDMLYILVRVGNAELLDVFYNRSGQARRALLFLRLVSAQ